MARDEATELAEPPRIAGRYEHVRELGRGASGRVILVEDRLEGGRRAVKIVGAADGERLRWERSLLASLSHPGLARVDELITVTAPLGPPMSLAAGAVALVETWIPGPSAAEAAAALEDDPARIRFTVSVGSAVARALSALHAAGLVHGDVKPANVVVPEDVRGATLVDLGLARPIGVAPTVSGTPAFLAPEAWLGERSVATDLYALGVTFHALLSGRTAYDTGGSTQTIARALGQRPRIEALPSVVPLALRRLIGDLLADTPADRPDSAREVALRLAGVASEVGAEVDDTAAVSDAPSPAERAARAALRPLVGRGKELAALVAALSSPGATAVVGPPGAGRSRLVREAARVAQQRAAEHATLEHGTLHGSGLDARPSVPTYVVVEDGRVRRLDHDAICHVIGDAPDVAGWGAAIEAADVRGLRLGVIFEVTEPPDAEALEVPLGPLDDAALRTLVAELLEVDPSPRLLEAARAASAGLPGRLCRAVAEGFEAELDPSRPQTLEELGRRHAAEIVAVPDAARALAHHLAVAGGALPAEAAERLLANAAEQARVLIAHGLAYEERDGRLALRDDVRRAVSSELSHREAARIAEALAPLSLGPTAAAHVHARLDEDEDAAFCFGAAMARARSDGDPERAAAIGAEALATVRLGAGPQMTGLRLATADALRARAREADGLALLEGLDGAKAAAARAELRRLLGDLDGAETEAEAAGDEAHAVRARIALSRGGPDAALEALGDPTDDEAPRLAEVRALAELMLGRVERAATIAARGVDTARRAGDDAAEARALSVEGSVLQAAGRVEEAAARQERAFELADRAGERHLAASALVNVGLGRLERGDPGGAIEALREGARRLTALSRRGDAARALYNLGNAAVLVGDDDLGRDALRRATAWASDAGDASASALAAVVDAELSLRSGKVEAARRTLDAAWVRADLPASVRVTVGARRAVVAAVRGHIEAAHEALAAVADEPADRASDVERIVARARVALAEERFDDAAAHAGEATERARDAGWESGLRAALVAAESFERADRPVEATAALARARGLLDAAAATLSPRGRARLRAVTSYERAFGTAARPAARLEAAGPWRTLARRAKALVREPRLPQLYAAIVDAAVELADAERGFLVTRSPSGRLDVRAARAFGAALSGERPSASVAARVLDGGRPLVTVDALEDDRLDQAASVHAMALRSVLAVPLSLADGRPAALILDDRLRPGAFDEETVRVVSDLAEIAAGAVERAQALRRERRERRRLARHELSLRERVESAEQQLTELRRGGGPAFAGIVAESEPMRRALRLVERVATSDAPVLVLGESGTGKELVARAVHDASPRRDGPYVSENCSAIPATLLESTLFGHVRGAFTGADRARRGLFEIADGGTLFLDEIGEMSEPMQAKLLRVLQDGKLRPIGAEEERSVDVRLVAATHRDLERMVEDGAFRQDLYYRIAVITVGLPALRDRPEDVAPLVAAFLERHAPDRRLRVDEGAMRALRAFDWPGNVRQLENEIRRALLMADDTIAADHLSPAIRGEADDDALDELDLKGQVDALERRLIIQALARTDGNQTRAATLLGVSRYGLQKMIKRLDVPKP